MLQMTTPKPTIRLSTTSDLENLKALAAAQARDQFFAFRRMVRPDMLCNWFVERLELELQEFYKDFAAGKRPVLAIMAPPQHGKSWTVTDFIAWCIGKNPDWKMIFTSYSVELGTGTNHALQRILTGEAYQLIFPLIKVGAAGWQCNSELVEFAG